MKTSEIYHKWISENIKSEDFLLAFIFGSVARNVDNPNDCDLFLVTKHKTNSELWKLMRLENETLKNKFYAQFNLELSIQLLSENEFNEKLNVVELIVESPKIIIIDNQNLK